MIYSKPEMLRMVLDSCDGTDPALACSIIHALSQWNPNAHNVSDSSIGGVETWGLFQFSTEQAKQYGYEGAPPQLLEVVLNVTIGISLMRNALQVANNRAENALLLYLGRSRAAMVPAIIAMVPRYTELIQQRPN